MRIDLKNNLTIDSVKALIASQDDTCNAQLRISKDGFAYLSTDKIGGQGIEDLHCRFETWAAEGGWMGVDASQDECWVRRIHKALEANWPTRSSAYIASY